jgi:hypothetical protein
MKTQKKNLKQKPLAEVFKDSIEVKAYIKTKIKANEPIEEKKLKGFKFVNPL